MALTPLQRLASREREAGVRENGDRCAVAGLGELGEGAGEEVVAGSTRGVGPVSRPRRGPPAPHARAVDQVVVDERRLVNELDRDTGGEQGRRRLGRAKIGERGPKPLASRGKRVGADRRGKAGMALDRARQPLLDRLEVSGRPGAPFTISSVPTVVVMPRLRCGGRRSCRRGAGTRRP